MKSISTNIRSNEINAICKDFMIAFGKANLNDDQFLNIVFCEIQKRHEALSMAINRDKLSSSLLQLDNKRDDLVKSIKQMIIGYTNMPIKDIAEAAKRLKKVLDKYGMAVTRENYLSESSMISSLIRDFDTEQSRNDINRLQGVPELMNQLRSAENEFINARVEYDNNRKLIKLQDKESTLSKELVKYINENLVVYLKAMLRSNPDKYGMLANSIEASIDRANALVALHKSGKQQSNESLSNDDSEIEESTSLNEN